MDFKFQRKRQNEIPESKILDELEKAAKYFNYIEFGWRDFNKVATVSANTVKKYFGTWKQGLLALDTHLQTKGLKLNKRSHAPNRVHSDKEMFDEMERIWKLVGQRPSRTEWETSSPKIAYGTYKNRFGGWVNACSKFIEYKMGDFIVTDEPEILDQKNGKEVVKKIDNSFSRSIPLSMRLKVLNRDNFRCVFCGKSPATDLGTKLHIDHIHPFSQGGKSVLDNLQTLCFECNLGKSNKNEIMSPTRVL